MQKITINNGSYKDTAEIYQSLTDLEKNYIDPEGFEESPFLICRKVLYLDKKPVSFVEIIEMPYAKNNGYVVVATKKEFRNNGYSKLLVNEIKKEIPKHIINLIWLYDKDNIPSEKMAISLNFSKIKDGRYERRII